MLYFTDSNVLIDANRDYYPLERVPQFWSWLLEMGQQGLVKVPQEVYDKVTTARADNLSNWLVTNREVMLLSESVSATLVRRVLYHGYALNFDELDDIQLRKLNEDPFLIAYALADVTNRCVVTTERSRPRATGSNRKIPDVCGDPAFNVACCDTFALIRELDFRA